MPDRPGPRIAIPKPALIGVVERPLLALEERLVLLDLRRQGVHLGLRVVDLAERGVALLMQVSNDVVFHTGPAKANPIAGVADQGRQVDDVRCLPVYEEP